MDYRSFCVCVLIVQYVDHKLVSCSETFVTFSFSSRRCQLHKIFSLFQRYHRICSIFRLGRKYRIIYYSADPTLRLLTTWLSLFPITAGITSSIHQGSSITFIIFSFAPNLFGNRFLQKYILHDINRFPRWPGYNHVHEAEAFQTLPLTS